MSPRTHADAYRIAHAAGTDAANRRAQAAGRKAWSRADYREAARVCSRIMAALEPPREAAR